MKKSLLALAVVAAAASANAATVYDKDGTSLNVTGRIQSVYYSNNYGTAGNHDSSIQNSARFGLAARTQITDWVAGIAATEWDMDDHNTNKISARDQWVGADFGEYGVLQAGKFRDASYWVDNVTDHFEDAACVAQGNFGARRPGQIMYTYENYGFHGQLGIQTALDNAKIFGDKQGSIALLTTDRLGNSFAVDSGFSTSLGYTFDDVLFGPLSLRAGYSYMKGQSGDDVLGYTLDADGDFLRGTNGVAFKNFKQANAGISWGNLDSGLYLAALYEYAKLTGLGGHYANLTKDQAGNYVTGYSFADNKVKVKGFELVAGYAWDNGVSFLTGYEVCKYSYDEATNLLNNPNRYYNNANIFVNTASLPVSYTVRRIPVFVNYKINSNFNVWGEVGFNAGSDHASWLRPNVDKAVDHTVFSVGARYTF
ncbi:outer membrane protein N [Succinivibrio dextrinosolvens]|uniref:porin n=1 Tax=Succinivibrio dextrinosolvens TaxID=83771 RepID=UPI0008EB6172|nr:porin [Succinivibrio dextrinosolvens]SFS75433.1 outer membrane protein N [Succinivibrio dextrinosolvens]